VDDPAGLVLDVVRADAAVALVRSCLPRDQAEVILLRVLGGLEVDEVAAIVRKRPGMYACSSTVGCGGWPNGSPMGRRSAEV